MSKRIGFCFGVKRAVSMAEAALAKRRPIYSLGSIIHNSEVVEGLSRKGLKVIKDISKIRRGTLVISSHGISPKIARSIERRGIGIIDTTCPFVANAQRVAKALSDKGYAVVIVGDVGHPEVKALVDYVPHKVFVVKDKNEARALEISPGEKVSVISQTTQSTGNFNDVVRAISAKSPKELKICNTICKDAESRQRLARQLAKKVSLMLVVGGRNSANTKRLYEVCKEAMNDSYLIETEKDINDRWFEKKNTIGITSGASTPDWVVKRVVDKINKKGVA